VTPWLTFAGCVLVVAVLSWAQAVLLPLAFAVLLTFVLAPPVAWLERWVGRVLATLSVVVLVFTVFGLVGWGLAHQLDALADDLPQYRTNIQKKIQHVRSLSQGGSVEKLQETVADILVDLEDTDARKAAPVVVTTEPASVTGVAWIRSLMGPLGTAGLVVAMVIFMLIDRRNLRDRLIRLFGSGDRDEAETIDAFDEVATRVSRQLLMQALVSVVYGVVAGVGLYLLEVPYPWVWAVLGAVLRFIPYVGPAIGMGVPILVSLATSPDWYGALMVIGLYLALELFTNMVLETVLYAGAAGISPMALLISAAFWTWLWGPAGLLLATPLAVCLVVAGKHVDGLGSLAMLLEESPTKVGR